MRLRGALLRWVLAAVALPVAAEVADRLGRRLETTRGRSGVTRGLRSASTGLRRVHATGRRG
ncbi:MAG: hypothetical protein LC792_19950 [Actinobacteria bacterium]|nr:hypothetical protein [Actinomycetota bacterium]